MDLQNQTSCQWIFAAAKGFNQVGGIDFSDTFSPVVKSTAIRVILTIALAHNWDIKQFDFKNDFLNGHLLEKVFMEQPPGFEHLVYPHHVCQLKKALYRLRQAPRACFDHFSVLLLSIGFFCSTAESSSICHGRQGTLFLLLYMEISS